MKNVKSMSKFHESKLNEEKLVGKIREILRCEDVVIRNVYGYACRFDVGISNFDIGLMGRQLISLFKELEDYDMMIIPDRAGVLRFITDVNNKEYYVQNS
jgi:hypothetical protein